MWIVGCVFLLAWAALSWALYSLISEAIRVRDVPPAVHHYHIDATASADPALVAAAVQRAIAAHAARTPRGYQA